MADVSNAVWLTYVIPLVIGVVAGAGVMWWVYRRAWEKQGAKWFVALVGTGSVWGMLQLAYLAAPSLTLQGMLHNVLAVPAMLTFAVFVVFVSAYTDRGFARHPASVAGLVGVVGGSVVLVVTQRYHNLLYTTRVHRSEPFMYYSTDPGVGFVGIVVLVGILIGYSWLVLVVHLLESPRGTTVQMLLILFGGFAVALAEVFGNIGLFPANGMSHAVYGNLPFLFLATVALFRHQLFDIEPVARSTIVEHLDDPILLVDGDTRLIDYNDAASHRWEFTDEELGSPLDEIAPSLARALTFPTTDKSRTDRIEVPLSGRQRHFSVTVTAVERGNRADTGWYALLLRDVTEIEQSREQLEIQNERLDQVASTISHDLRNPIQVAEGYADFLEEQLEELPEGEQTEATENLADIEASLDRMKSIIDDVLTFAREGSTVEEPEPVSLATLAREAWSNVDTGSATLSIEDDTTIHADRSRALSIFENMFRNAIDHGGPEVAVSVGTTPTGFYVADDGSGIDPAEADAVFDYGYTTAADGTGFGLSIVRTIAEAHGWTVELDQSADGARFEFVMPGATPVSEATVSTAED